MYPETADIREGEEVDLRRLREHLTANGLAGDIHVSQFPGGSSNLTYLLRVEDGEYVLRRPPMGNTVKRAHDMRREFEVLSKLSAVYQPAPRPVHFCEDTSVIESEFYLMERRRGLIIRGAAPEGTLCTQAERLGVCRAFVENLAALHAIDPVSVNLCDLGRPDGYNRRQVEGWSKRYVAAKTDDHPEIDETIQWLNSNIPPESGTAIIHNDYKFDNVMLDPNDLTRVVAVLDWEMATIGDPLMDLGTTLGYWLSPEAGPEMMSMPFNPRIMMENVTRRDLADMYSEASGKDLPDMLFYYVFGTFKIAVIAQQIYARYARGTTKDARFASFDKFVAVLGKMVSRVLERGAI